MLRWLLLIPLLLGLLSTATSAQVFINPGDGQSVKTGGSIHVDNWTGDTAFVEIRLDDGTLLYAGTIPAWGWHDYGVPNEPVLVGRKVTTTVKTGGVTTSATNLIISGGMALTTDPPVLADRQRR